MKKYFLLIVAVFITLKSFGQRIDNTAAFRQINGDKYFKIHYENDLFSGTDYYYSQGVSFEFVHAGLNKNPINKLLLRFAGENDVHNKYGLDLQINAFTPTNILTAPPNDRPYAATLSIKSFLISNNYEKNARLSSGLVVGVIGEAAFGKEIQTGIHRVTKNNLPLGWGEQIKNDLILNYKLNHEKLIFDLANFLALNTNVNVSLGTLNTKLQTGMTLMAGTFISPFQANKSKEKRFQLYAYSQPLVSLIGYDATLQGGILNRNSPYTIADSKVTRLTFENQSGIILQIRKLHLEAFVNFLSKEFTGGKVHRWGGLKIGIQLP